MRPDGSEQTRITFSPGTDTKPTWSPDGTMIAFTSDRDSENFEIHVMNADGSDQRHLVGGFHRDLSPAWSPPLP